LCLAQRDRPGIVGAVKRRLSMFLLPLAAASLGAGCTTLSDDNVAVRVDDTSYTHDVLADFTEAIGLPENDLGAVRSLATDLVLVGAIESWLDEAGIGLTDDDLVAGRDRAVAEVPGFAELDEESSDVLTEFFALINRASLLPDVESALAEALDGADIYVDPRIGNFDPSIGAVIPLG